MRHHLPSVEALSDIDDRRLLAELEVCQMLEKLARVRALVERANHLLSTVLACGEMSAPWTRDPDDEPVISSVTVCNGDVIGK
jgi:hypothetical protein